MATPDFNPQIFVKPCVHSDVQKLFGIEFWRLTSSGRMVEKVDFAFFCGGDLDQLRAKLGDFLLNLLARFFNGLEIYIREPHRGRED